MYSVMLLLLVTQLCLSFCTHQALLSMGVLQAKKVEWVAIPFSSEPRFVRNVHHIVSPCLFNFDAKYIMQNARLDESQAGIKIAGKNINNLRYADDTTLMAKSEEELESHDEGERGE